MKAESQSAMRKIKLLCLLCGVLFYAVAHLAQRSAGAASSAPPAPQNVVQEKKIDFARDVAPILKASCASCHSGEGAQAELRLDAKAAAMKGGVSGAAIIPGSSKESLLIKRIHGEGGGMRMPPGNRPLPKEQIDVLARWIARRRVDGRGGRQLKKRSATATTSR